MMRPTNEKLPSPANFDSEMYAEALSRLSWLFPGAEEIVVTVKTTKREADGFSSNIRDGMIRKYSSLVVQEPLDSKTRFTSYRYLNCLLEVKDKTSAKPDGTTNQNY